MRRLSIAVLLLTLNPFVHLEALTVDEIIHHYIDARGGAENLKAIRTLIYRGTYREGTYSSPHAAMSLMRPYYKLVGDAEHPNPDFAEGYDGSTWELYGDPGVVIRTVGAASAAGRHATNIDGPLVDYRLRNWEVTLRGTERIGDRSAYRLHVRMPDGFEQDEFIDTETWLLIAERKAAPIHAFGNKVASEERISDYRPVAGVLIPYLHSEVEIATGKILNEVEWREVVANRDLDISVFSPPPFTRTPLQDFLERLFAERTDTTAVLWSYRDFRTYSPGVDTDSGVNFIGYQMLKAEAVAAAIALLKANAADHPSSASAAYSLGRAYATAKETAAAKRELQRALQLDPNHKRAREELGKLQ